MKLHWKSFLRGFTARAFLLGTVSGLCAVGCYILTQQPKVWCDQQWAGIALYKGGYRSWTLTFCDGFMRRGETMEPITINYSNGVAIIREGYHWPKYRHADLKRLGIAPPP